MRGLGNSFPVGSIFGDWIWMIWAEISQGFVFGAWVIRGAGAGFTLDFVFP
jgi:hypothetical protein